MGGGFLTTEPLPRGFFARHASEVAPDLLGRVLVHGGVAMRLTEVEAYGLPGEDPAAHTYRGMTKRNAVMFGPPGHLYVYFTYGMHFCANLVCLPEGHGSAVLLRAGEVIGGVEVARARRPGAGDRDLARGPARLAMAFGFARAENGIDMIGNVLAGCPPDPKEVSCGPRTGISTAMDVPWRFWIEGDPTVSPYRRSRPRGPKLQ
ncbi:DNA-3-methyladenine glycosylase [Thermoactinospora rubra]|uniref:DNA-3-methyladenine glycosylase n=1 Tax=Thermoactinospora rubra TaxID=1088767 RepID=UPI000A0F7E8F|nr:DNA-3-methyladenine glycosylase [Thermoactinospora rubra]